MLMNAAAETNIIFYLMAAAGIIGIISKMVNQVTLSRLVKAAGNMSESRHKLMKLVLDEYGHACLTYDSVDNVMTFIRKYLYEYRGFLFRVHTWRQLEIQTIWFSGILAVMGAYAHYMSHGFCEGVFRFAAAGAAEMIMLFVISQLTDEAYKIKGAEIYMADYLDNVCSCRYKKKNQAEKERIPQSSRAQSRAAEGQERKRAAEQCIDLITPKNKREPETNILQKKQPDMSFHAEKDIPDEEAFSARKEEAVRLILAEFLA